MLTSRVALLRVSQSVSALKTAQVMAHLLIGAQSVGRRSRLEASTHQIGLGLRLTKLDQVFLVQHVIVFGQMHTLINVTSCLSDSKQVVSAHRKHWSRGRVKSSFGLTKSPGMLVNGVTS